MVITFGRAPPDMWNIDLYYLAIAQQGSKEISRLLTTREQFEPFIKEACGVFKTEDYTLNYKDHVPPLQQR